MHRCIFFYGTDTTTTFLVQFYTIIIILEANLRLNYIISSDIVFKTYSSDILIATIVFFTAELKMALLEYIYNNAFEAQRFQC